MIEERIWFSDQRRYMPKPVASNKILICLPFWEGDREQMQKLVQLLADLEPGHSVYADILFVPRFDTTLNKATLSGASRKFNVFTCQSKRRETGWPTGCNALFFAAMEWIYFKSSAGQIPRYKAIFNMAADTAPLRRGWIEELSHSWECLNQKRTICSAGALLPAEMHGRTHINGDCMLLSGSLSFLKWLAVIVGRGGPQAGWDWALADEFQVRGWADLKFVRSIWRKDGFSEADWDHEIRLGTVIYHGVKNDDLLNMTRRKCLT